MDERNRQADLATLAAAWIGELTPYTFLISTEYILRVIRWAPEREDTWYSNTQLKYALELLEAFPRYLREQWAKMKRYEQALEHYADEANWMPMPGHHSSFSLAKLYALMQHGFTEARRALGRGGSRWGDQRDGAIGMDEQALEQHR